MQRVENAWLIYNTEGNELGGGEKSRFISQFIQELPKRESETGNFRTNAFGYTT